MSFATFILGWALVGHVDPKEVDRLIARHEATLARIRTFRGTIESRQSKDGGKTWKILETVSVFRDGRNEYVQDKSWGAFYADQWQENQTVQTTLFSPSECRTLSGWDPENPPRVPIADEDLDRVRGALTAPAASGAQGWSHSWKGQALFMVGHQSLRELVQGCIVESLDKDVDPDGGIVWRIRLRPKKAGAIQSYTLSLPSRAHYLISTQETRALVEGRTTTGRRETVAFWDLGSDLTLPRRIRTTLLEQPDTIFEVELKDVVVNQPFQRDWTLEFPEGAIVVDHRSQKYHLWGKGEPARTFTQEEFRAWNVERQHRRFSKSLKRKGFPIIPLAGSVMIGLGALALVLYRRRVTASAS